MKIIKRVCINIHDDKILVGVRGWISTVNIFFPNFFILIPINLLSMVLYNLPLYNSNNGSELIYLISSYNPLPIIPPSGDLIVNNLIL